MAIKIKNLVSCCFLTLVLLACNLESNAQVSPSLILPDLTFNNLGTDTAWVPMAHCPDGSILTCGRFSQGTTPPRHSIQRLVNGHRDESYASIETDNVISGVHVLHDGKAIVIGYFNTVGVDTQKRIARLNKDGTLDTTFSPVLDSGAVVHAVRIQPDGKIILAGSFSSVNGVARECVARLNEDGTLDTTFVPPDFAVDLVGYDPQIYNQELQCDGKILLSGSFFEVAGISREGLVRLNSDGSLDTTFVIDADYRDVGVKGFIVQESGKIVVASNYAPLSQHYTTMDAFGYVRNVCYRLNANGSTDYSFNLKANGSGINNIIAQSDGNILIQGLLNYINGDFNFTTYFDTLPSKLYRVTQEGDTDVGFNVYDSSEGNYLGVMLQDDGKMIIPMLTLDYPPLVINGQSVARGYIRLSNNSAIDQIAFTSSSRVEWKRGGSAPATNDVVFDISLDGFSWQRLGAGSRTAEGWAYSLTGGASFPADCVIRGRARTVGGDQNRSSGLVEQTARRGVMKFPFAEWNKKIRDNMPVDMDPGTNEILLSATSFAMQADGKVLIAGFGFDEIAYQEKYYLRRFNPDGTLDTSFSCTLNSDAVVRCILVRRDGKIVICGWSIGGSAMRLLNANGSTASGYPTLSNQQILTALLLPNDDLVVNTQAFTSGYPNVIRRFSKAGGTYVNFAPSTTLGDVGGNVLSIKPLPDGKFLVAGQFDTVIDSAGSFSRSNIARLNSDGTWDSAFDLDEGLDTEIVGDVTFMSDGNYLSSGVFREGSVQSVKLAKINADGDFIDFLAQGLHSDGYTEAVDISPLTNGELYWSGHFYNDTNLQLFTMVHLDSQGLRLPFNYPLVFPSNPGTAPLIRGDGHFVFRNGIDNLPRKRATQILTVPNLSRVQWLRQGVGAEVSNVWFDHSTDGVTWTELGTGTRIAGGWELTGLSLPSAGWVRAQGRISHAKSGSLVETIVAYPAGQISVTGNGSLIANGAQATDTANHTLFPALTSFPSSSSRSYTIHNAGSESLVITDIQMEWGRPDDFGISGITLPATVPASSNITFTVTYNPQNTSPSSSFIVIESNGVGNEVFTFKVEGAHTGVSNIEVSGGEHRVYIEPNASTWYPLDNGTSVEVNRATGRSLTYTISNTGTADLYVSGITLGGTHASDCIASGIPVTGITIEAGETHDFEIFVQPSSSLFRATVTVNSNHPVHGDYTFWIGGNSIQPTIQVSGNSQVIIDNDLTPNVADHTEFEEAYLGSSSHRTFTLENTGTGGMHITDISVSGPNAADFTPDWTTAYLYSAVWDPGLKSKALEVDFNPSSPGLKEAVITVETDDPENPEYVFKVSGLCTLHALAIRGDGQTIENGDNTPSETDSTDFLRGVSGAEQVVAVFSIENAGNLPLEVNGLNLTGTGSSSFTVTDGSGSALTWPVTLNENENFPVKITYAPAVVGIHTATVNVYSDAPMTPVYNFTIQGRGITVGEADAGFNPVLSGTPTLSALAIQPDGKILIGGNFTGTVAGASRNRLTRLNADGTLDPTFNPLLTVTGTTTPRILAVAVQPDGKILVGGAFTAITGTTRYRLARLNTDGTVDTAFNPVTPNHGLVNAIQVQPDGKILIGGTFDGSFSGVNRQCLARLNSDGSLDFGFDADIRNGAVNAIQLQPDGQIILGGTFTNVAGTTGVNRICRVNASGVRDTSFTTSVTWPNGTPAVNALLLEPDGQILIGGAFIQINGTARNRMARLNSTGTLDTSFDPSVTGGNIETMVLQADGKLIIGGTFTQVTSMTRNRLARISSTGVLDSAFNPAMTGTTAEALALQPDGRVIVSGAFSAIGGSSKTRLARLENNLADEDMYLVGSSAVEWLRSGSAPEVSAPQFAVSSDGGATWTEMGTGTAIAGGWELTGLILPTSGMIRARAYIRSGNLNGSSGIHESYTSF